MKNLIATILFFIAALFVFSKIPENTMTGATTGYCIIYANQVFYTLLGVLFLGTSVYFFTLWFYVNKKVKIIGIIPARMGSSRFPGKPLAKINGIPMIKYVYDSACKCKSLDKVYVATPDVAIFNYIKSIDGNVIITKCNHTRASERVLEALITLEISLEEEYDYVVMIQGDEPMIQPFMIEEALKPLILGKTEISNLMYPLISIKDINDKNTIKVVTDKNNNALYFSRSPIPSNYKNCYKQVCVISFTKDILLKYRILNPTPLEIAESIDMMRFVENDIKVKMVETETYTHSVDTKEDLKLVEKLMMKALIFGSSGFLESQAVNVLSDIKIEEKLIK